MTIELEELQLNNRIIKTDGTPTPYLEDIIFRLTQAAQGSNIYADLIDIQNNIPDPFDGQEAIVDGQGGAYYQESSGNWIKTSDGTTLII